MTICACGCGEEITPLAHHSYMPAKYKQGHWQQKTRVKRSSKRIPPGTACACGCGKLIPETYPNGFPRYAQTDDGLFYVRGHRPPLTGDKTSRWKGGRVIDSHGYVQVLMPGHHLAGKNGYVPEHRLKWEEANGRRLEPWEDVHHIDSNRANNSPENLAALTKTEHAKEHRYWLQNTQTAEDKSAAGKKGAAARWG